MKCIKFILIGIGLVFLISLLFLSSKEYIFKARILDKANADIDGDGTNELIVLNRDLFRKHGKEIVIYSNKDELIELYVEDFSDLKPWKIDSGDVDGDGIDEISVGVYKETIFHPVMAKRPFIYSFEGDKLVPKWRGSRLSRPFTEYTFFDLDKDGIDELISIEELADGRNIINSYKWRGFGFEGFMESESYQGIHSLNAGESLSIWIEGEDKYYGNVIIKNNNLVVERMD